MADGLKIGWNQESINQMIRQIEEMENKVTEDKINISINKDSVISQLDSMLSGIKNMQEKASQPIDLQINTTKSQEELANIKGSFEDIANAYKNLGNVSFSSINFDGNGMLKDFTIQLEQVNGLINKIKYNAKDFVDGKNSMTPLTFKVDSIKQINDIDKVIDKVDNLKNKYNDAIKDLQNNGNVKESSIGEFQKELDSLNTTNFKEKANEIENTYSDLLAEQKQYNEGIKQQEQLNNFAATQKNRLENIRNAYNGKIDTGSSQYIGLENTYKKLIDELSTYEKEGKALTTEETNDIKERISNFGREKSSILEVTNTIKQQENALDGLKNKFGNIIPDSKINEIKQKLQGLYTSTNLKSDTNSISQEIDKLKQLANEVQRVRGFGSSLGTFSGTGINMGSSIQDIERFIQETVSAKASVDNIKESMDSLGNKVKTVNYSINEGNGVISKHKMTIDGDTSSLYNLTTGLQNVSSKNNSFSSSIGNAVKNLALYTTGAGLAYEAINKIKEGIKEIEAINRSNVNVAMITGDSIASVQKNNDALLDMAKNLKVVNSEVLDGQESWMRSGVSMQEANKDLETTTKLSKIADVDNKEMADSLIVIKNAYGLGADELKNYASKVALLDNASATSSQKINAAMQYSAQTFKSMGIDMNTALSWITNYSEKSAESGEAIGNHFKSLLENFHKLKAGYKEGNDEDVESVNKIESILNAHGIALRKTKDQWQDLGTVVKEIQQNIGKFSDVDKSNLAFKIGGKENAEATLATLNNLKEINQLQDKLKSDSGAKALNESYDKYKQGIDAQLANLKNSVTSFWMHVIDEKKVESGVGEVTKLIKVLEVLATTSKSSGIELAGLVTTMVLLIKNFSSVSTSIGNVTTFFKLLPVAISETNGVSALLSTTFGGLATSIKGVTVALATNPLTWVIAALGVATYAIMNHVQHQEEMKEKTDSLKSSYENLTQAMKDNSTEEIKSASSSLQAEQKKINDLVSQQAKAKKQLDEARNNYSKSPNEAMSGDMAKAQANYDAITKSLQEEKKAMDDAGVSAETLANAQNRIQANEVIDKIKETTQAEIDHKDEIMKLGHEYDNLAQLQKPSIEQQEKMSDLAQNLSKDVSGLTTVKDKDGNVTIKNSNLLNAEIGILGNEGVSVKDLQKIKLEAAKSNENVQIGETNVTYAQAKARMGILNEEAQSWAGAANQVGKDTPLGGLFGSYSKNTKKQATDIQEKINNIDSIYSEAMKDVSGATDNAGKSENGYTTDLDNNTKATKENTAAQKAQEEELNNVKNAVKSLEDEMKNLDNIIYKVEDAQKGMYKGSQEYRDSLQDEINLLKQKSDLIDKDVSTYAQYGAMLGSVAGGAGGSALGQQIVNTAEQYLGTPYVSGGSAPGGFDCSGLVQYVYDQVGISLNRTSEEQYTQGTPVSKSDLQPGDLVFFEPEGDGSPGHVAIYAGGGEIIAATHSGSDVKTESLEGVSEADGYVGARRIISGGSSDESAPSSSSASSSTYTGQYADFINEAASKYGVPAALIAAVIDQESNFDPNATSSAGAKGLMQKMEGTNLFDPESNIMQGTEELAEDLKAENGDISLALAAYNAGLGNVQKYGGIPPFKETQNYVPSVLAKYKEYGGSGTDVSGVVSEMDDLNSKEEDLQKNKTDNLRKIIELYDQIYDSQLTFYKDEETHIQKNLDIAKQKYDYLKETNLEESQTDAEQVYKEYNNEATVLKQKEQFIRTAMAQNTFDKATLFKMQQDLDDTVDEEDQLLNTLHSYFSEWIESKYTDAIKFNKDQVDELQSQLDVVTTKDKENYGEQLDLNKQSLDQQTEIKAITEEQIADLEKLIANEKEDTTRQVWLDELNSLYKKLNDTNKTIIELQTNIDNLGLQNKMKNAEAEVKNLNSQLDILNEETDASRANNEDVNEFSTKLSYYNTLIADRQKENDLVKNYIDEITNEQTRFEKDSQAWIELQDQKNDLLQQEYDKQKDIMDLAKKQEELAENQVLNIAQQAIYGGETQQEFEDNAKARENAIDEQLKLMDKQEQNLEEQETRNKNLLDLEEARVKLQQDQANRNVQQLTKDKNGNWQFTYVANQETVDSDEKDMRDKMQSNDDYERQTAQKHEQDDLNDEKSELEEEVSMRQEAMDRIKTNIENAFNDQKELFKNGQTDIGTIVENSLNQISDLYDKTFPGIADTIRSSVESVESSMNELTPALADAQSSISGVTNPIDGTSTTSTTAAKHTIFATGQDLVNAREIYGDAYNYKDTDKWTKKDWLTVNTQEGDIVVGTQANTPGLSLGQATRLGGDDRTATAEQMMGNALSNGIGVKRNVYASGQDYQNALKTLNSDYYNIINTGAEGFDASKIQMKSSDWVLGGEAVTTQINNQVNESEATRIYGQTADDTNKALEKARDADLDNVKKYNQNVTKNVKTSTNEQTIIVKDASNSTSYTIKTMAQTNQDTIKESWAGINNITTEGTNTMVITVQDKCQQAVEAIQTLLDAEAAAGITPTSTTPTRVTSVNKTPSITAKGSDASILRAQFGSTLNIDEGDSPLTGTVGSDRVTTNQKYLNYVFTHYGLSPINNIPTSDFYKYKEGGLVNYTGLAQVDGTPSKPESFLNADDTSNLYKIVQSARDLVENIGYNSSVNLYQQNVPNLMPNLTRIMPDVSNLVKNNFKNQPTKVSNTFHFDKVELPNVTNGESFLKELSSFGVKQYTSSYKYGY